MKHHSFVYMLSIVALCLIGCSGQANKNKSDEQNNPQAQSRILWDLVPAEFNPQVKDIPFQLMQIEKIDVNVFGFQSDFELIYSRTLTPEQGFLRLYRVFKESANWGSLIPRKTESSLELRASGAYSCNINIKNGQIVSLNGACYVRVQIYLPMNSKIEVFNVGKLISKKFFPTSNKQFFDSMKFASTADAKFIIIEDFLNSYLGTDFQAQLNVKELTEILRGMDSGQDKLECLRRLHRTVDDRPALKSVIESEFYIFDRAEALKIAAL